MVMKADTEEVALTWQGAKHHPGRCFTEISQRLTWANCSLQRGRQSFFCSSVEQRGRGMIICLPSGILTPSEEQNLFTFRRDPLDLQHWPACRTAFQIAYCLRGHVHAEAPWNKNKEQWKDSSLFGDDVKDPISVCCEVLYTTLFLPYPAECTVTSEHLLKAREQTRANPVLLYWLKGSHEASSSQCHPTNCPSCQQNSWAGVRSDLWRAIIQNTYLAKARDIRVEQCSDSLQIARSSLCC